VGDEVFRRPVIDACRVDADRVDAALDKKLGRLARYAGEVQVHGVAGLVGAEIGFLVAPAATPPAAHHQDRMRRDAAVLALPAFDIGRRQ
jgi:hypothetical protein